MMAAVRPAAELPLPEVNIDNGATLLTNLSIYDLAVDGSPIKRMLISPLSLIWSGKIFIQPLNN